MKLRNTSMYVQARTVAEPEFMNILVKHGFSNVRQGNKFDDFRHNDVFGTINGVNCTFDVKDLTAKNVNSTNYSLSKHLVDSVKQDPTSYSHHYLAFRLYDHGKSTGEYMIVRTTDACKKLRDMNTYYLVDSLECKKYNHRIFS